MKVKVQPGKYVLAVSGGVDSMTLLDLMVKQAKSLKLKAKSNGSKFSARDFQLVIAHFNHGIRADSDKDEQLVRKVTNRSGLTFEIGYGNLGASASEEKARVARYGFLNLMKEKHRARAVITAHHQDDLIETAFLNLLRGTHRRGLSSIVDSDIIRPLLKVSKKEIIEYAVKNKLVWREDSTNINTAHPRNYLRLKVLKDMTVDERMLIISNIEKVAEINNLINLQIATLSHFIESEGEITRGSFISLPPDVASELMCAWLREHAVLDFDAKTVQRLSLALKTGQAGSAQPVKDNLWLMIDRKKAHFTTTQLAQT